LLCAPGEEEEIKWLGAVRALMARRSNLGNEPVGVALGRSPAGGGGGSSSVNTASTTMMNATAQASTADASPPSSGFASSNGPSAGGGGGSGLGGGGVGGNGSKSSKKRLSASHGVSVGGTALSSNVIIEEELGSLTGHGGRS
jgi:pleckstrin homology domain-containing family A member 1/2